MKNLLGIFLLTFAVIIGFSGSVAAATAPVYHGHSHVHGQIIESPGATISSGNVNGNTSGDVFNNVGSKVNKKTTNSGSVKTVGNKVY